MEYSNYGPKKTMFYIAGTERILRSEVVGLYLETEAMSEGN